MTKFLKLAKPLHEKKKFFSKSKSVLKCDECGKILLDSKEAVTHSNVFKHTNFSQLE